jgi:hypothetical protein
MIPIVIIFVPGGKEKQELELDEVKNKIYNFLLSHEDICRLSNVCRLAVSAMPVFISPIMVVVVFF